MVYHLILTKPSLKTMIHQKKRAPLFQGLLRVFTEDLVFQLDTKGHTLGPDA